LYSGYVNLEHNAGLLKPQKLRRYSMQFKIDTKPTYFIIAPVSASLDANLTAALTKKCAELTESGSENFIIDLNECTDADIASFDELVALHQDCYSNDQSIVFTQLNDNLWTKVKEKELDLLINIAPTMQEAIDIVSMEILERDLFKEE